MAQKRRSREQWQVLIRDWPGSGLTVAQYCERRGISVANFHRWQERLRRESAEVVERPRRGPAEPIRFLPVHVSAALEPPRADPALTLVFAGGVRLEVVPGFDAATLQRVVQVLRGGVSG
jgi:hypothetical protein